MSEVYSSLYTCTNIILIFYEIAEERKIIIERLIIWCSHLGSYFNCVWLVRCGLFMCDGRLFTPVLLLASSASHFWLWGRKILFMFMVLVIISIRFMVDLGGIIFLNYDNLFYCLPLFKITLKYCYLAISTVLVIYGCD